MKLKHTKVDALYVGQFLAIIAGFSHGIKNKKD